MTTTTMASAIYTPTYLCQSSSSSSSSIRKPTIYTLYSCKFKFQYHKFSSLHMDSSTGSHSFFSVEWSEEFGYLNPTSVCKIRKENKMEWQGCVCITFWSWAPEALVIGVVALLVFGPKGLAEVARNLGKTLCAFQPTIKELQDVSREFKSTLEREIGLDDVQSPMQNNYSSSATSTNSSFSTIDSSEDSQMKVDLNGSPSTNEACSSEDYLKIMEEQLKAAGATQQLKQTDSLGENQSEPQSLAQLVSDTVQEAGAVVPPPQNPESET